MNRLIFTVFLTVFAVLAGCGVEEREERAASVLTSSQHTVDERDATSPLYAKRGFSNERCEETDQANDEMADTEEAENEPIEIVFAGDVMFERSIEDTIQEHGPHYPFEEVRPCIQAADYAIVNLETAVTEGGEPEPKQFTFRTGPESLEGLAYAGFDAVSLANNHAMDYGKEGLKDTFHALDAAGIGYVGAGVDKNEAYEPHVIEIGGTVIHLHAYSQVLPTTDWYAREEQPGIASGYQKQRVTDAIEASDQVADYVLVYMHWGTERTLEPEEATREYALKMTEAGADAVIGAHPHVLQGVEYVNGKPVAYSIGNFLFPDYVSGVTAETGLLSVELEDGEARLSIEPFYIQGDRIIDGGEAYRSALLDQLEDRSFGVKINSQGLILP